MINSPKNNKVRAMQLVPMVTAQKLFCDQLCMQFCALPPAKCHPRYSGESWIHLDMMDFLWPFSRARKKKDFPFFSCGETLSRTVPKTQALQATFALLERVDLRSQKGGIWGKKIAWGREGWTGQTKKKAKRMRKKRWVLSLVCTICLRMLESIYKC